MRLFYVRFQKIQTVSGQLTWSQSRLLIQIPDSDKREYYELEAVNNMSSAVLTHILRSQKVRRCLTNYDLVPDS